MKLNETLLTYSDVTGKAVVVEPARDWRFVLWQHAQYIPCWDIDGVWVTSERKTDKTAIMFMGGNVLFVFFLMVMRHRFIWWPFHPGGYVLSGGAWSGMFYIWNAVLISFSIKWFILKYGGLKAYRKACPFFFGLVLGDYIIGCAWNIIGLIFNMPAYSIW